MVGSREVYKVDVRTIQMLSLRHSTDLHICKWNAPQPSLLLLPNLIRKGLPRYPRASESKFQIYIDIRVKANTLIQAVY